MKINPQAYAGILAELAATTLKQLEGISAESIDIEPIMGIASVNVGNGVQLTLKLEVDVITAKMMMAANNVKVN